MNGAQAEPWFCKHLGDGILAAAPLGQIEDLFRAEYVRAGAPADMALFVQQRSDGLHCAVSVYFSPAAAAVARAVDAVPCGRPLPEGLDLLVGAADCRAGLF
jgi:hypothetical protein